MWPVSSRIGSVCAPDPKQRRGVHPRKPPKAVHAACCSPVPCCVERMARWPESGKLVPRAGQASARPCAPRLGSVVPAMHSAHGFELSSGHMRISSIPGLSCRSTVLGKKSNSTRPCGWHDDRGKALPSMPRAAQFPGNFSCAAKRRRWEMFAPGGCASGCSDGF